MDQKDNNSAKPPPVEKPKVRHQQKRTGRKKPPPRKKINPTAQSLVGIFVFAMGLALIIAVMYLAYAKFFSAGGARFANTGTDAVIEASAKNADNRDAVKNIDKASFDNMVGQWAVRYGILTAYVTITENKSFQITLFMDTDGFERRVQSGTVVYDDKEGVLELRPSYERLPKPKDGILKTLTRSKYSVIALMSKKDGDLIWVPHIKEGLRDQVHPLFRHLDRDESFIRWSKSK